jgi:hypothetical protein
MHSLIHAFLRVRLLSSLADLRAFQTTRILSNGSRTSWKRPTSGGHCQMQICGLATAGAEGARKRNAMNAEDKYDGYILRGKKQGNEVKTTWIVNRQS